MPSAAREAAAWALCLKIVSYLLGMLDGAARRVWEVEDLHGWPLFIETVLLVSKQPVVPDRSGPRFSSTDELVYFVCIRFEH